jgi:type II secretory pathway pseudopilin PulG
MKANSRGFTIIEVFFVLAIAGLILLLIFQAIPALQRISRNNQRKQDIATILRAASQYELQDSGNFPNNCSGTGGVPACITAAVPTPPLTANDFFLHAAQKKLTYYTNTDSVALSILTPSFDLGASSSVTDINKVFVYNYQKCHGTKSTYNGAGYSDVVALYALENGKGSGTPQCQQL